MWKKYYLLLAIASFSLTICNVRYADQESASFLLEVLKKLEAGENIIFTKYGDGEYYCMRGDTDENCDGDKYHPWLGEALKKSLVNLCKKPNTYIGKWWNPETPNYCDKIVAEHGLSVPWKWYHLFMNDDEFMKYDYMYKFVQFLHNTSRKKILVCNERNKRNKDFFKADVHVEFPSKSWSYEYEKWKNELEKHVVKDAIVLISAGLCTKVLIDDLSGKYDATFIDLGSSFDMLACQYPTRDWRHSYAAEIEYYKDFIPESWK